MGAPPLGFCHLLRWAPLSRSRLFFARPPRPFANAGRGGELRPGTQWACSERGEKRSKRKQDGKAVTSSPPKQRPSPKRRVTKVSRTSHLLMPLNSLAADFVQHKHCVCNYDQTKHDRDIGLVHPSLQGFMKYVSKFWNWGAGYPCFVCF